MHTWLVAGCLINLHHVFTLEVRLRVVLIMLLPQIMRPHGLIACLSCLFVSFAILQDQPCIAGHATHVLQAVALGHPSNDVLRPLPASIICKMPSSPIPASILQEVLAGTSSSASSSCCLPMTPAWRSVDSRQTLLHCLNQSQSAKATVLAEALCCVPPKDIKHTSWEHVTS